LIQSHCDFDKISLELQKREDDGGFTDIEIISGQDFHIIIEAKKGWDLPSENQLQKYLPRFSEKTDHNCVVSLSAASQEYAENRLHDLGEQIKVEHRSWHDIQKIVSSVTSQIRGIEEKIWLRELNNHLKGYVSMQDPKDNTVFVVSLSQGAIKPGDDYSWVNVVEDGYYFHPVGNRWPVIPPNYIGFRWDGLLQSIHHIGGYEVTDRLQDKNPKWPDTDTDHFVYALGPPMKPPSPVKNGKIWPSGRYWCAIDTLLSGICETISEARDETNRRLQTEG
jgi:hypothetical protein